MWVSSDRHQPYVSRETWMTRGWLLVKKCRKYDSVTENDRQVAKILLEHTRHRESCPYLAPLLEVISDGTTPNTSSYTGGPA